MRRYLGAFGVLLAVVLATGLGIPPAPAAERWATDQFFRVEAEPVTKGSQTVISGDVYNLHYSTARATSTTWSRCAAEPISSTPCARSGRPTRPT